MADEVRMEDEMGTNRRRRVGIGLIVGVLGLAGAIFAAAADGGTFDEDQLLFAADPAADDYFGYAVATDGTTVMVGAIYDDDEGPPFQGNAGSVRVFETAGGVWTEVDRLEASVPDNSGYFGSAIAIDGDTAVIGSYGWEGKIGAAYVFVREMGSWVEQAKLGDLAGSSLDNFGCSVAIDGDTVAVGAYGDDNAGEDRGSVFVFTRSGTVWSEEAKLTLNVQVDDDWFGYRVAISGDTLVASALEPIAGPPNETGSAYVFNRTGSFWSEDQKLNGSGGVDDRNFGNSIQLEPGTLVIGSQRADHSGLDNAGAVYVFAESGGTWTEIQKLTASDAAVDDGFGAGVALAGDTMVVGADLASVASVYRAGTAYVFEDVAGTWVEGFKLIASSPESEARLGFSVAATPEIALVGAPWTDSVVPPAAGAGAACFYDHASYIFADHLESGTTDSWDASVGAS
jgi:hypothetical protein